MSDQEKYQKVAKIEELEGVGKASPLSDLDKVSALCKAKFEAALDRADKKIDYDAAIRAMEKEKKTPEVQQTALVKEPSPIDAVRMDRKVARIDAVTPESVIAYADELREKFGVAKKLLTENQDIQFSKTQKSLLNEKLTHVDTTLKATLAKTGAEVKIEPSDLVTLKENPVFKFVSYLTQSENRLQEITAQIQRLSYTNGNLSPEKLLAVQLKMGFIQHELEFFTNIVNKALESTKTIMNVQV